MLGLDDVFFQSSEFILTRSKQVHMAMLVSRETITQEILSDSRGLSLHGGVCTLTKNK
jgi:hypothetical protein